MKKPQRRGRLGASPVPYGGNRAMRITCSVKKRTPTEADALAMRKALEMAGGWGQADIRRSGWDVQKVPCTDVLMPLTSRANSHRDCLRGKATALDLDAPWGAILMGSYEELLALGCDPVRVRAVARRLLASTKDWTEWWTRLL